MSKRKQTLQKQIRNTIGYSRRLSGASMSEAFPSFIESSYIEVDITNKVKPYTRTIDLVVKQHGQVIGNVRMFRRP